MIRRLQLALTRRALRFSGVGLGVIFGADPGVWDDRFVVRSAAFPHRRRYPWWCRGPLAPVWVCDLDLTVAWWSPLWWAQHWTYRRWMFHRLALSLGALRRKEGGYYKDMRPMNPFTQEAKAQRALYRDMRQKGYFSAWWR